MPDLVCFIFHLYMCGVCTNVDMCVGLRMCEHVSACLCVYTCVFICKCVKALAGIFFHHSLLYSFMAEHTSTASVTNQLALDLLVLSSEWQVSHTHPVSAQILRTPTPIPLACIAIITSRLTCCQTQSLYGVPYCLWKHPDTILRRKWNLKDLREFW